MCVFAFVCMCIVHCVLTNYLTAFAMMHLHVHTLYMYKPVIFSVYMHIVQ